MSRNDVVSQKQCECGCGGIIKLKEWHFKSWSTIPRFILGHNPATRFKMGNKGTWKGGKTKCNGYWLIYKPDHPHANSMGKGYVRQCRLLAEEMLGRYLESWEVVHHINGVRDDDRPENIIVLTNSKHLSLHHKQTVKKQPRGKYGQFVKGGDAYAISE